MGVFSRLFGGGNKKPRARFTISHREVVAKGWTPAEFEKILSNFAQLYRDRLPPNFSPAVHADNGGVVRTAFPDDLEPDLFCFLVNYGQYPGGFDLDSRTILAGGRATIDSDFLPADQSLIGKRMLCYIPADD